MTENCTHPQDHTANGGPFRYCDCGWIEDVTPPVLTTDERLAIIEGQTADILLVMRNVEEVARAAVADLSTNPMFAKLSKMFGMFG